MLTEGKDGKLRGLKRDWRSARLRLRAGATGEVLPIETAQAQAMGLPIMGLAMLLVNTSRTSSQSWTI